MLPAMSNAPGCKVVLIGATGAVGSNVLATLLGDPAVAAVTTFGRRTAAVADAPPGRLVQHVADMADPAQYRDLLAGHTAAVCTLGVGQPSKMARDEVRRIEVDYVIAFAEACRAADVARFSLMTSAGADARSRFYYLRMKGELEARVAALGFRRVSLFRPSMLLTPENRYGLSQGILLALWPKVDFLFAGSTRRYRGIRVEDLGRAIALDAVRDTPEAGTHVYEWDGFQEIFRGAASG
jgi:uncharacterized protein YbjT (DUF2867 family)